MARRVIGYMSPEVFDLALKRIGAHESKALTWQAARLVLVDGKRISEVLKEVKLGARSRWTVYRSIDAIERSYTKDGICPCCGGKLEDA